MYFVDNTIVLVYNVVRTETKGMPGKMDANRKRNTESKRRRTTGIEWTDHTWNVFVGCSIKSSGCKNCYAMALAARLEMMGQRAYRGLTKRAANGKAVWTGKVVPNTESAIKKPLSIGTPSIFFVNSMSDFFHDAATDDMRMTAFGVIESTPHHQYQILTKRPDAIAGFLKRTGYQFPDNVWIGATVENNSVSDRIDIIKNVPARIKFLSVEPLIGEFGDHNLRGIDWVITGGESGPDARECRVEWLRDVRDLCTRYDVRHFFKQWGKPENNPLFLEAPEGTSGRAWVEKNDPVGKGGSKLDGRYWKEMPENFTVSAYFDREESPDEPADDKEPRLL